MKQNFPDPFTERHVPVKSKEDLLFAVEHLCRSAPIGMALLDTGLRFVHVNELMAEANGVPADAHVGRTLREIVPEIVSKSLNAGLILNSPRPSLIRFMPALNVSRMEINGMLDILEEILRETAK